MKTNVASGLYLTRDACGVWRVAYLVRMQHAQAEYCRERDVLCLVETILQHEIPVRAATRGASDASRVPRVFGAEGDGRLDDERVEQLGARDIGVERLGDLDGAEIARAVPVADLRYR